MSNYFDTTQYEPATGSVEEKICELLETWRVLTEDINNFQQNTKRALVIHDEIVALVADLETRLNDANHKITNMHACPHVEKGEEMCMGCECEEFYL